MIYKLGRKAVKRDTRTLMLAKYLPAAALAPPPASCDWSGGQISGWGMMGNDTLGDCTIAGAAHAVQVWSKNSGTEETLTDSQVIAVYSAWDGYVPGDSTTDNGGVELDVLTNWRKGGLCGHNLGGFAAASPGNLVELRQAISLFGGLYIGLSLPLSAQDQTVWDVAPGSGPDVEAGGWGGHCVFLTGYDLDSFDCITWGSVKKMTANFLTEYCDEAYALFGADWINSGGEAPLGVDAAQLDADLALIR